MKWSGDQGLELLDLDASGEAPDAEHPLDPEVCCGASFERQGTLKREFAECFTVLVRAEMKTRLLTRNTGTHFDGCLPCCTLMFFSLRIPILHRASRVCGVVSQSVDVVIVEEEAHMYCHIALCQYQPAST